ncbi:hypothetical protein B0H13DRAFT_2364681 [Mycena leptocephala]|nr:hypothetical protein B0H13DRAFT_2364681 [Mycena leptocephala]
MAIISTTPCPYSRLRPTRVRPMRRVRLLKADPLDRWLATADVMLDPDMSLRSTLPEGEVMCAVHVTILEGLYGAVYRLSMVVYDRHAGYSEPLGLGRHQGVPTDADVPLWTRRLPPGRFLRFSQPRVFVARLVAGLSDIPLQRAPSVQALSWARDAAIGTSIHRLLSRRCKNAALRKIKVWARGTNLRGL